MSDYDEDYDYDYDDADWLYVEDEYMAADDLAEHAVASPPPTNYGDEDMLEDWDRFDYFNDIEYASDGYDDAKFQIQDVKGARAGQKRERAVKGSQVKKKRIATTSEGAEVQPTSLSHSPIRWRSQESRDPKPDMLDDDAQPYALFKNWREQLPDTPAWAKGSPAVQDEATVDDEVSMGEGEGEDEEEEGIPQEALLMALQQRLAAAGGPLKDMDQQQLLDFAMRMMSDKDAGDDIAGEMAEAMFEGEDEEDDTEAGGNLESWLAQQRDASKETTGGAPRSPKVALDRARPPTPPSSEANRSVGVTETVTKPTEPNVKKHSLKRKADDDVDTESSTKIVKKRTTRSFDAPTAASQAKATSTTRTTRANRPS